MSEEKKKVPIKSGDVKEVIPEIVPETTKKVKAIAEVEPKVEIPAAATDKVKEASLKVPVVANKESMKQMLAAGVHFGHTTTSWNPKMAPYIFGERNRIHIIDLTQSLELLNDACNFLQRVSAEGEVIIVGTKKQAQEAVLTVAKQCGAYSITKRWPGGLLTNFKNVRMSIEQLEELIRGFEIGIENRTKRELMLMKKQMTRLLGLYQGLLGIKRFPKAVIVIDSKLEHLAVKEAMSLKIPVIAFMDTNSDPGRVRYPIPGNDDATASIWLVLNTLGKAIAMGNKGRGVKHIEVNLSKIDEGINRILEGMRKKKEEEVKIRKEAPKMVKLGGKKVKIIRKSEE
jgi:small subunit ribosomal protein S2